MWGCACVERVFYLRTDVFVYAGTTIFPDTGESVPNALTPDSMDTAIVYIAFLPWKIFSFAVCAIMSSGMVQFVESIKNVCRSNPTEARSPKRAANICT